MEVKKHSDAMAANALTSVSYDMFALWDGYIVCITGPYCAGNQQVTSV